MDIFIRKCTCYLSCCIQLLAYSDWNCNLFQATFSGKSPVPMNQQTSKFGGKTPTHQMSRMSPTLCSEPSPPPPMSPCTPSRPMSQLPSQSDHRAQRPTVLHFRGSVAPSLLQQDQEGFANKPPDKPPVNSERGVSVVKVVKKLRADEEGRDIAVESNSVVHRTETDVVDYQLTGKRKHMDDIQCMQQSRTDVIQCVQASSLPPPPHAPTSTNHQLIDIGSQPFKPLYEWDIDVNSLSLFSQDDSPYIPITGKSEKLHKHLKFNNM